MNKVMAGVGVVVGLVVVGVGGLFVVAAGQPDVTHVERSLVMAATPADVMPALTDLKVFEEQWSPWADLDPNQTVTYSPSTVGAGAWYTWSGDENVGAGKMSITAVEAARVDTLVEFTAPFQSTAKGAWTVAAEGQGARVTWSFDSENDLMAKAFGLFMDMDQMLGADFDKGLNKLKPIVEAAAVARVEAETRAAEEMARAAAAQAQADADAAAAAAAAAAPVKKVRR